MTSGEIALYISVTPFVGVLAIILLGSHLRRLQGWWLRTKFRGGGEYGHIFNGVDELEKHIKKEAPAPPGYTWELTTLETAEASHWGEMAQVVKIKLVLREILAEDYFAKIVVPYSHIGTNLYYSQGWSYDAHKSAYKSIVTSKVDWAKDQVAKIVVTSDFTPEYRMF